MNIFKDLKEGLIIEEFILKLLICFINDDSDFFN